MSDFGHDGNGDRWPAAESTKAGLASRGEGTLCADTLLPSSFYLALFLSGVPRTNLAPPWHSVPPGNSGGPGTRLASGTVDDPSRLSTGADLDIAHPRAGGGCSGLLRRDRHPGTLDAMGPRGRGTVTRAPRGGAFPIGAVLSIVFVLLLGPSGTLDPRGAAAQDSSPPTVPAPSPSTQLSLTPDAVLGQLNRTLSWYTETRTVMRSVNQVGGLYFGLEDEQTALLALQRAFDVARAQADLLARSESQPSGTEPSKPTASDQRARLDADVKRDEQELAQLTRRADTASPRTRPAIDCRLSIPLKLSA